MCCVIPPASLSCTPVPLILSKSDVFPELVQFITSGPVVAVVVEGRNAISAARTILGATDSSKAESGSIRGDYGLGYTDNIIHASDSAASFEHEQGVAFQ